MEAVARVGDDVVDRPTVWRVLEIDSVAFAADAVARDEVFGGAEQIDAVAAQPQQRSDRPWIWLSAISLCRASATTIP